jgi:alpha-L-fucosidase 2
MKKYNIYRLLAGLFLSICPGSWLSAQTDNLTQYNVVWNSPSEDSFGSMPLGNGDIGLNVWVEKNGDLLFYISKVDAYDAGHLLPKLGRIRIKMEPALPTEKFKQTLILLDASVLIEAGDVQMRVWVDANQPVIRLGCKSKTLRTATITLESLRTLSDANDRLPDHGTAGILFNDHENRLIWCFRNLSSAWAGKLKNQNSPEMVAKAKDPIMFRTSGCFLQAKGFIRESPVSLKLKDKSTNFDCSVKVISTQPETLQAWLREASQPAKSDWVAHCAYWNSFWSRSYINIKTGGKGKFNFDQCRFTQFPQGSKAYEGHKEIGASKNVFQISQRYALERFCEAAAGRGAVPAPYNGSIFTMDMPAGVKGFDKPTTQPATADYRDWAMLSFMWQNTRLPYWSMACRGDYDAIRPAMQFVRDGLDICRDHCKKIFGHDGAFIMEASWWYNVGCFNWEEMPKHLRYHQLATIELPAIMCEYYEHTRDPEFLKEILLPCADEFIKYFEVHFPKRDDKGNMLMEGVGCAETYQGVTNPCTEIGGLKYVLTKLVSFDIDETRLRHWSSLLKAMPGIPLRRIRGLDLLAVGDKYDPGRTICESPELYSVYPFRQVWLGQPELLAIARQSFHLRTTSLDGTVDDQSTETGGWQTSPIQAAYLGLPREAARLASINFNDQFILWNDNIDPNAAYPNCPRARFPAFWEKKMDYTPDNDHGANSVNTLQSMLLQSDGKKIFLLPAWPEDWDVSFKLCAALNTTVECQYHDGKVQSLKVTPESRRADIIDRSTAKMRIRNLLEVTLADHNYLFGLAPMLDAQPVPGKTTFKWIAQFGKTIRDCKAGPWPNALFKGNIVYVHVLDWPKAGVRLSSVPLKLVSAKSITGNVQVTQDESGWLLTGKPDSLDTIVRLEFSSSVEEIAKTFPSAGSFTAGRECVIKSDSAGYLTAEVDLGKERSIDRFEFTIGNPGYLRGQGRPYEFQVKQTEGTWKTVNQGKVFGIICSKKFNPVAAQSIRLVLQAATIQQFDVF